MRHVKGNQGFTLVELVTVMMVVAVLLNIIIPNLTGMQNEAQLTKVEGELATLKTAIVSYWRNNNNAYPPNIHSALTSASPAIVTTILTDPYKTDTANSNTYGYKKGTDATFGDYFAVYSKGPKGDTTNVTWDAANQRITYTGSGRCASNAPVVKQ